jgi:hypothetical protein
MRPFFLAVPAFVALASALVLAGACTSFSGTEEQPAADAGPSVVDAPPSATCTTPRVVNDPNAKPDASCGPGGAAVDLLSSAEHCGACNHRCGLSSACEEGLCKPTALFNGQLIATAVVVGDVAYYVGTDRNIYRGGVNATKGDRLNLAAVADAQLVRRLSVDSKWLFVSETTQQQRISLVDSAAQALPLAAGTGTGGVVALAKNGYFYAEASGVQKYDVTDTVEYTLPSPGTKTMVADGDVPFWLTAGADDVSLRGRVPTGEAKLLATTSGADALTFDADYIYMADAGAKLILRVPRTGGNTESVATESGRAIGDIAVDGEYIYWTADRNGAWMLLRVAKCGGLPLVLAKELAKPSQLSFDATSVFVAHYSNDSKSTLLRIPK